MDHRPLEDVLKDLKVQTMAAERLARDDGSGRYDCLEAVVRGNPEAIRLARQEWDAVGAAIDRAMVSEMAERPKDVRFTFTLEKMDSQFRLYGDGSDKPFRFMSSVKLEPLWFLHDQVENYQRWRPKPWPEQSGASRW